MCYYAIKDAVKQYKSDKLRIWLYRGAWQEWDVEDVTLFVPMSRHDMEVKIESIFKHQSQKDRALVRAILLLLFFFVCFYFFFFGFGSEPNSS